MDVQIIAAIVGAGGVLIAAVASSIGYLYRARVDAKRSARRVLYLLLEIRRTLNLSLINCSELTSRYFIHCASRLSSKGIPTTPDEIEPLIGEMAKVHFENLISAARTDVHQRLLQPFDDALRLLSEVDPVLAYKIMGKENFEILARETINYTEIANSSLSQLAHDDWAKEFYRELGDFTKKSTLDDISESLDRDLLILAKSCGIRDYIRTRKTIQLELSPQENFDFTEIDKFIDHALEMLLRKIRESSQMAC